MSSWGTCDKDLKPLLTSLEGQGARIERQKGGHIKIFGLKPTDRMVVVTATKVGTGVLTKVKGDLRRAGWTI